MGKKAMLTPELQRNVVEWVRQNGLYEYGGANVSELLDAFGFAKKSFYRWRENNPEFDAEIREAVLYFRDMREVRIVDSLFKRAQGYTWQKKRTKYKTGKDGKVYVSEQTTEDVHVSADPASAIFLLTNLAPERWQNRRTLNADIKAEAKIEDKRFEVDEIPEALLYEIADTLQEGEHKRLEELKNGKKED